MTKQGGRADLTSTDARKRWRARQPEKDHAHRQVEFLLRRWKRAGIPKPPCEECGVCEVHAHHTDYSKPLDVRWLCAPCHIRGHWQNGWREARAVAAA